MYAPVSTLVLRDMGSHLLGYAAPDAGPAPCLLRLSADGVPVSAARATRYSPAAKAKSVRLGWCGVRVPGLALAAAVGTRLELRCGVTGRILWRRAARAPVAEMPDRNRPLTVFEIIALSRAEDEAPSLNEIRPLLECHLASLGTASLVRATYETFLGRTAERTAVEAFGELTNSAMVDTVLNTVMSSAEYRDNAMRMIPGPFNAAFRYDLRALDAA